MTSFKDVFDDEMVRELGARITNAYKDFDQNSFVRDASLGLDALELKARSHQIADALIEHLPEDLGEAFEVLIASMGDPDASGGLEGMGGFVHMPLLDVVARAGLDQLEVSLGGLERMTRHFSAEFAIRPFIQRYEAETMARMAEWSADEDWRVRRLASEGSRPRLPWGIRLGSFVEDPTPTLEILERLVEDPELIVRRSVANHLNDISKDHEDLAARVAKGWWERGSEEARWAAKHAMRTLVKRGHAGALEALGFTGGEDVIVEGLSVEPEVVAKGGEVVITFDLVGGDEPTRLVVDYALDRALANGKRGTKVFKIKNMNLGGGERVRLTARRSFKPLSTRTYHAGTHRVEVLINGRVGADVAFELTD